MLCGTHGREEECIAISDGNVGPISRSWREWKDTAEVDLKEIGREDVGRRGYRI